VEIHDTFLTPAPVAEVWRILEDPEAVAECFPGATLTGRGDDGSLHGAIRMNLGPTVTTFSGMARVTTDTKTRTATIETSGADKRGSTRVQGEFSVTAHPQGAETELQLRGLAKVTGPLAGFAENGGVHVLKVLVSDFAAEIGARASAPTVSGSPGEGASGAEGSGEPRVPIIRIKPRPRSSVSVWSMLVRALASAWQDRRTNRRRT